VRYLFLLCLLSFSFVLHSQSSTKQEIDDQVWKSFQKAYAESDGELFISIHSPDVRRVTPWGMRVGEEYLEESRKKMSEPDWPTNDIRFRFEHRIHRDDLAYEVGYYQIVYHQSGEEAYGRFHVVLEKKEGKWKIIQDWDTNKVNGKEVNSEDFYRLKD